MTPKRADELLNGGSLYWVIKGQIAVRQRLLELRAVTKNGMPHCGLVYDPKLVHLIPRACRPFQGWRYLAAKDAPTDARMVKGGKNLPPARCRSRTGGAGVAHPKRGVSLQSHTARLSISRVLPIFAAARTRAGRLNAFDRCQ